MEEIYFYGELVQNEELDKVAKQRKKKYQEITVPKAEQSSFIEQGWELKRELKNRVILRREKECDELLEDEVWLLFKDMGFIEMNKDRNFKIQAGPIKKQIDIFAKDGNNIFVIKCKAQSEEGPKSLRKDIHGILNLRKDVIESIQKKYKTKLRISFLLVTKNIVWSSTDEKLATVNRKHRFFFWKEAELEAYTNLTNQLGKSAKFQLYSILFFGKKSYELGDIEVPAIYGGKGREKYYSFIIQPEKLLQVSYVHRRERSNPEEVSGTYQRMIKKTRLNKICEFIEKGGFFPNNIVLNFTQEPMFEKKDKVGDITYGILKFPPYYGSAWIIDGQHRLYGYSETEKRATETVPVVAFVKLKDLQQATFFVEINREQKAISSNLLWDLYPDIYHDVKEEKYQILRAISLLVKRLNSEPDSPLYKHINIPSVPRGGKDSEGREITNLMMATICDVIKDTKLLDKEQGYLFKDDYETTVNFAYERLKVYFDIIKASIPGDWEKGDKGLLRTNIGIGIFIMVLRQVLGWMFYCSLRSIVEKQDLSKFAQKITNLLSPAFKWLDGLGSLGRSEIRKATGKGPRMDNAAKIVLEIEDKFRGFGRELLRSWWPSEFQISVPELELRKLSDDLEKQLRAFVAESVTKHYGENWWREDIIPKDVIENAERVIKSEYRKTPYMRRDIKMFTPQEKLDGVDLGGLTKIILKGANWHAFEGVFLDKEYTRAYLRFFKDFRDPDRHVRETLDSDHVKLMAYGATKWIRKCIGLETAP